MQINEYKITVTGVVQGIGFRPSVYRLAQEYDIKGEVRNSSNGVILVIQTNEQTKNRFIKEISSLNIPGIRIDGINIVANKNLENVFEDFQIKKADSGDGMTEIPIDSAMCLECKKEIRQINSKRYLYPLTACTNCGPRITVIQKLPYNREDTTMSYLKRCPNCERNYYLPTSSRRFNFETDSCWDCCPWIGFVLTKSKQYIKLNASHESHIEAKLVKDGYKCIAIFDNNGDGMKKLIEYVHKTLDDGNVVALKGVGGYQIVADATNPKAVDVVRTSKNRKKKPLAVMFSDFDMVKKYCICSDEHEMMLDSNIAPIVLIRMRDKSNLAHNLTFDITNLGAMIPNSPIHNILVDRPLVMTSANISGEPLIYEDDFESLSKLSDGIFLHDRQIHMGIDDSLIKKSIYGNIILRYARGFTPTSFSKFDGKEDGIAFGADLKSAFTIISNNRMILSQYIGDLEYNKIQNRFLETLDKFRVLFKPQVKIVFVDKHPAYHSRNLGIQFARANNCKLVEVQHHYAHALSVMAEHSLNGKYTSIVLDGTGYGEDGKIWGGEILLTSRTGYKRKAHFEYIKLIGGEKAVKQPYRQIISIMEKIDKVYRDRYGMSFLDSQKGQKLFLCDQLKKNEKILKNMLNKNINCVETSSAGRVFDLVAAMVLGVLEYDYEGEAATLVEQHAQQYIFDSGVEIENIEKLCINETLESDKTREINNLLKLGQEAYKNEEIQSIDILAHTMQIYEQTNDRNFSLFAFHIMLAAAVASCAYSVYRDLHTDGCILSGGVFQNAILRDMTVMLLHQYNVNNVYTNITTTSNDGSISLGQAYLNINKI